jgi:hypothetical protein
MQTLRIPTQLQHAQPAHLAYNSYLHSTPPPPNIHMVSCVLPPPPLSSLATLCISPPRLSCVVLPCCALKTQHTRQRSRPNLVCDTPSSTKATAGLFTLLQDGWRRICSPVVALSLPSVCLLRLVETKCVE